MNNINELAKNTLIQAAAINENKLVHQIYVSMQESDTLGHLMVEAASHYTQLPYTIVDDRMQAGKALLGSWSKIDFIHYTLVDTVPLPFISSEAGSEVTEQLNSLCEYAGRSSRNMIEAGKALAKTFTMNHPTNTQTFLRAFRDASLGYGLSETYNQIGSEDKRPLPFI